MATYHAIAAVGRTIVDLMENSRPPEFPGAQFALFRAEDFARPMQVGVSVCLYRVASVRTSEASIRIDPTGDRRLPAIPLSLHYLVTPWGADPPSEHVLLAWVMRVLADAPVLSSAMLNRAYAGTFQESETVELIWEDHALADQLALGRFTGEQYRLGVCYCAQVVLIDSASRLDDVVRNRIDIR